MEKETTVRTTGFAHRAPGLTEEQARRINRRMYLLLQLATILDGQAEELERELAGVGVFRYDIKHKMRQIRAQIKTLWKAGAFGGMTDEQVRMFGNDGEQLENLINGVIDGHIKKIEYEVEDNINKD